MLKFWWSSSFEKTPVYWRKREILEQHKSQGGLSLRNISITNKALLFNQAWRIHKTKDSLIHQLYRAKYKKKDPLQLATENEKPKKCSYAFNSLFKACNSFKNGLYKKLGNGKNINLAQDRWSPAADLKPLIRGNQHPADQLNVVADLIDENKAWKANKIWANFSPENARNILAMHIPKEDRGLHRLEPHKVR